MAEDSRYAKAPPHWIGAIKNGGKGWEEAGQLTASGELKAPEHVKAANKRKVAGVSRVPMVKSKPFVELIRVRRLEDNDPDLSYLTQFEHSEDPEEQKYYIEDKKRLAEYGNTWVMYGIRAEADIQVPMGVGTIFQKVMSGGLWGIESDSDKSYFKEVGDGQIAELKAILKAMKIKVPVNVKIERLEA